MFWLLLTNVRDFGSCASICFRQEICNLNGNGGLTHLQQFTYIWFPAWFFTGLKFWLEGNIKTYLFLFLHTSMILHVRSISSKNKIKKHLHDVMNLWNMATFKSKHPLGFPKISQNHLFFKKADSASWIFLPRNELLRYMITCFPESC